MYPSKCQHCGSIVSKPVDVAIWGLEIPFQRTNRDHVGVVCLNRDCRHYQIFRLGTRLGETPELDTEGNLDHDDDDAVVAAISSTA